MTAGESRRVAALEGRPALRYLSLGAGVQSTTLALMIAHGVLPPIDCAIFADTHWEPKAVYAHLDWLCAEIARLPHPFPVYRVSAGSLRQHVLDGARLGRPDPLFDGTVHDDVYRGIPAYVRPGGIDKVTGEVKPLGMLRRQCTRKYKIAPITAKVRELLGLDPGAHIGPRQKRTVANVRSGADIPKNTDWEDTPRGQDMGWLVGPKRRGTLAEVDAAVAAAWPGAAHRSGRANQWEWYDHPAPDGDAIVAEAWRGGLAAGLVWYRVLSPPPIRVEQLTGISTDEADRAKPAAEKWLTRTYPLLDIGMNRMKCIAWMLAHGYPEPPRSACLGCPLHSVGEWKRLRRDDPEGFADAVAVDEAIRGGLVGGIKAREVFLHARGKPLIEAVDDTSAQADFTSGTGERGGWGNECEGGCGV